MNETFWTNILILLLGTIFILFVFAMWIKAIYWLSYRAAAKLRPLDPLVEPSIEPSIAPSTRRRRIPPGFRVCPYCDTYSKMGSRCSNCGADDKE